MKEDRPSLTAERVAMHRAAHQLLDNPKVLDDPIAVRILGREGAAAIKSPTWRMRLSPLAPYLRAHMAVRSRFAEDTLAAGVLQGVRQYVILGAGLDTFAYRSPYAKGMLRVFEVDHPMTQSWKRARLEEVGLEIPTDLTLAPINFETQTLAEGLREAGFDPDIRTFFSWLGVTHYLTNESVMATLQYIASMSTGSGVVFDYAVSPSRLKALPRMIYKSMARRVANAGEPWKSFFDPEVLAKDVRQLGFSQIENLGPPEINARYFRDRTDGLQVGSSAFLMNAQL